MILYGYRMNDYDNLLRLSQAELSCSQEELKKNYTIFRRKERGTSCIRKRIWAGVLFFPLS